MPSTGASTEDERHALGRCLFTLLFLVAGADGQSTDREVKAIEVGLLGLDEHFGPGHCVAIDVSPPALRRARAASEGLGFHLQGEEVALARRALDHMEPPVRASYEAYFIQACMAVAEASADFLGLGAKINADEQMRMRDIIWRLGLQVTDAEARRKMGL